MAHSDPEKAREYNREYQRRWRAAHRDELNEKARRRYAANPEKQAEASRRWRAANPEKAAEKDRRWYEANREKVREATRRSQLRRRWGDLPEPLFGLAALRQRLNIELKKGNRG
jgi:hypothetical protein